MSAVATGGVYKRQGRIRGRIVNDHYEMFRVHEEEFQSSTPTGPDLYNDWHVLSDEQTRLNRHCMTLAAQNV